MEQDNQQLEQNPQIPQNTQDTIKPTQRHIHNGSDSPRLNPKYFLGFINNQVVNATIAPTYTVQNGTLLFQYDGTNYYMWIRINNLWKHVALT